MALLNCKNVNLGYNTPIVEGLNFDVHAGDYLCIVGENGSGKSTLMKTILGLKEPLSGNISFSSELKKNEIGYLPQQTDIQKDFPASVYEVVLSGRLGHCGMRPFYSKKDKAMALENIKKMEITHLKNKCYRELSGGQQQRVLLARALCASSKMLFLDEPVSGLDPNATKEMYEVIETLNKKYHVAIVMISHDIEAAVTYASHILHVSHIPLFFGKKEDYVNCNIGAGFLRKAGNTNV